MLYSRNTTGKISLLPAPQKNKNLCYIESPGTPKAGSYFSKISALTAKVDLRYSLQNILSWALRIMHFQYKEMVILNIGHFFSYLQ